MIRLLILAAAMIGACANAPSAIAQDVSFSETERAAILRFGPWPPLPSTDASNRVSGDEKAIRLGLQLFNDPRLSPSGRVACASCHQPEQAFADGRPVAIGVAKGVRNTPSLLDTGFSRWFGWAGANDTLWGASIRPITAAAEMASAAEHVQTLITTDTKLAAAFTQTFGASAKAMGAEPALMAVGKALAAYQETLISKRTSFDQFRDALAAGDTTGTSKYADSAKRGLKLFIGEGRCSLCHLGPRFTNGEFDDIGIPFFTGPGKVDKGRYAGIQYFKKSAFTRLGAYSDDPAGKDSPAAIPSHHVALQGRAFGSFKVPSLRGVQETAPYMHNGTLNTLPEVINHYSKMDQDRLHIDDAAILRPLNLTPQQALDLEAFLRSLSPTK